MKRKIQILFLVMIICSLGFLEACSSDSAEKKQATVSAKAETVRDNTPLVRIPAASGKKVYKNDVATIDASNKNDGYIMAEYHGKSDKLNIQITGPDGVSYLYFITKKNNYITMPLSSGSGKYTVDVYENIEDEIYSSVMTKEIKVKLKNKYLPFLYPNQYVSFNKKSKAVGKGAQLAKGCTSDLQVLTKIYEYVVGNISYDYDEAENVDTLYLPDIDQTLASGKGICFDYAALMCAMLRTQRIPAKLDIGYTDGGIYHAWLSAYIKGYGWVDGIIEFNGKKWTLLDPTFASTGGNTKKTLDYISNPDNYEVLYQR